MDLELFDLVCSDIDRRSTWARRQATWYQMRRDGIRRRGKPWPGAADLHYPLADTIVEKMLPFYLNQLFATDRLVDMVCKDPQRAWMATEAAYWLDYKLKHHSNLEDVTLIIANYLMQYGHGILKPTWNFDRKCVQFDAIIPTYIILPPEAEYDICYADRIVHVRHLSPWQYKHGPESKKFNQDEDFIARIRGSDESTLNDSYLKHVKESAEGITHSCDRELIVLWEVYERQDDGNYMIHTVSPQCPEEDVRDSHKIPYKNGYDGKPEPPFVNFQMELTDTAYIEARGACEILNPFQSSMERMWNEKHDSMTLYNRPMLTTDRDFPNILNIKCRPGQILPGNMRAIVMGAPPISYDQEMANCRLVAEQRLAIPDFGQGGQPFLTQPKQSKTATEVQSIQTQSGQVSDMRGRLFRRAMNKVFCQAWGLLKQYDQDLEFMQEGVVKQLPKEARDLIYSIKPNGTSDSWSIHLRMQRAAQRMQMFIGNPHINQAELVRSVLELDEPGLVARLFQDPNEKMQDQQQLQLTELNDLDSGFPIKINDTDDDKVHLGVIMQYIGRNAQIQKQPTDPAGPQMVLQHFAAHLQRLSQIDSASAAQFRNAMNQLMSQASGQPIRNTAGGNGSAGRVPPTGPGTPGPMTPGPMTPMAAGGGGRRQPTSGGGGY